MVEALHNLSIEPFIFVDNYNFDLAHERQMMEQVMIDNLLNCGTGGWLMIAGGVATYGVLLLAGAGLIKYLFSAHRSSAAG